MCCDSQVKFEVFFVSSPHSFPMASSSFILLGILLCIVNAQIIVYKRHATEIAVATRDLNIEVTVFNVGEG